MKTAVYNALIVYYDIFIVSYDLYIYIYVILCIHMYKYIYIYIHIYISLSTFYDDDLLLCCWILMMFRWCWNDLLKIIEINPGPMCKKTRAIECTIQKCYCIRVQIYNFCNGMLIHINLFTNYLSVCTIYLFSLTISYIYIYMYILYIYKLCTHLFIVFISFFIHETITIYL